mgnify:CR=1 FL=1
MPDQASARHRTKPVGRLGILMLDTAFDRPLGDAGNPASWPFPVQIERVSGAFARSVVSGEFTAVDEFIAAGKRLIDSGVSAIMTTCGFLVRYQRELAAALSVPVETSTLMHYPALQRSVFLWCSATDGEPGATAPAREAGAYTRLAGAGKGCVAGVAGGPAQCRCRRARPATAAARGRRRRHAAGSFLAPVPANS